MTQTKSFLREIDFTKQELEELIDLSIKFKQLKKDRIPHKYLDGLDVYKRQATHKLIALMS